MRSYHRSNTPNQKQVDMSRPVLGVNEYNWETEIHDEVMSYAFGAYPNKDESIKLDTGDDEVAATDKVFTTAIAGRVLAAECVNNYLVMLRIDGTTCYVTRVNLTTGVVAHDLSLEDEWGKQSSSSKVDSCVFNTEADTFVVFATPSEKKLVAYDFSAVIVTVDLAFKPKKIAAHTNRVFAIDNRHTLWWSGKGQLDTWYDTNLEESFILRDSGYWVLENESYLSDLAPLGTSLYIFSDKNIYVFRGYDYDSFSLQKILSNIGIRDNTAYRRMTVTNNTMYFVTNNGIYEFSGNDAPRVISRPVVINGNNSNSIIGGLPKTVTNDGEFDGNIYSDSSHLYFYTDRDYYRFDIFERSWWHMPGFQSGNSYTSTNDVLQLPYWNTLTEELNVLVSSLKSGNEQIYAFNRLSSQVDSAYFITKAFNISPSQQMSLTNVVLQVMGESSSAVSDITISLKTPNMADFVAVFTDTGREMTGGMELINVYVPAQYSAISRYGYSSYKIKVEVGGDPVNVFNIERHFRVVGRTR